MEVPRETPVGFLIGHHLVMLIGKPQNGSILFTIGTK
jgi:hypothetical protein